MKWKHVHIDGPRASLARVKGAEEATHLQINARLGSWAGLERFAKLSHLRVHAPLGIPAGEGLAPLGAVDTLRRVAIEIPDDVTGAEQLGRLKGLESLELWCTSRCAALRQADAWLGDLHALTELVIVTTDAAELLRIPLARTAALPRLTRLDLVGVFPSEGLPLFEQGFQTLLRLEATTPDQATADALRVLRFELDAIASTHPGAGPFEPEIAEIDSGFDVYLDLSERLGTEGNHEALEVVERRLRREQPPWAAELDFDPEAGGIGVSAPRREPLEAFLAWAKTLS